MKLALGLIETHGLVAAIEAADAMAKAANITIVGKEKSTAALVTIKIVGEVAAVKSAVDAGAAAAQRVGQLVSTHIIPRPADEINDLINFSDKVISAHNKRNIGRKRKIHKVEQEESLFGQIDDDVKASLKNQSEDTEKDDAENLNSTQKETSALDVNEDNFKEEFADVKIDISSEENLLNTEPDTGEKEDLQGISEKEEIPNSENINYSFKMEELEILNVHQLRKKARNISNFPIKGREISKANRGILLDHFKSLL